MSVVLCNLCCVYTGHLLCTHICGIRSELSTEQESKKKFE